MGLWKRKNNGGIPKLRESLDPIQKKRKYSDEGGERKKYHRGQ